jgi:hypothetical protein
MPTHPDGNIPSKRSQRHTRWSAKILPYVNDFLFFASTPKLALALRERVHRLLTGLGLLYHPTKGFGEPTQTRHHMGIDIGTSTGYFSHMLQSFESSQSQS